MQVTATSCASRSTSPRDGDRRGSLPPVPGRPYLTIDLATVRRNVAALRSALPAAEVRYAVKANPAEPILRQLAGLDCTYDVASVGEIDLCAAAGIDGALMTFGNPLKKPAEVAYAFARGVRKFTFDTAAGLQAIAANAPGSSVECRIAPTFPSSVTPFGHKFGCAPDDAADLLARASQLGVRADGVAFHVGSQQLDPGAWEIGIRCARDIFDAAPGLSTLNLGGGIPISYDALAPDVGVVGDAIADALRRYFPVLPHLVIEPGRAVVGSAGTLFCEVVAVRTGTDGVRELVLARWGMPSPAFALQGKKVDRGVTNVRNTASAHWRRWLSPASRCLVPFTSFSEPGQSAEGKSEPVWFAMNETRPLAFFAGIWTGWTSVRKVAEGEVTCDLYAFLTTEPNTEVGAIHPKSMSENILNHWRWL